MIVFRELLKKKIDRLFLVVWAPWGEEKEADIDISFGFVFKNEQEKLCVISVDKDELWSPHIFYEPMPKNEYSWKDYYPRMEMWIKSEDSYSIIDKEYYDVSECELFANIIHSEILAIELIGVEHIQEPFGENYFSKMITFYLHLMQMGIRYKLPSLIKIIILIYLVS